jgi:hypothetical protein
VAAVVEAALGSPRVQHVTAGISPAAARFLH